MELFAWKKIGAALSVHVGWEGLPRSECEGHPLELFRGTIYHKILWICAPRSWAGNGDPE